MPHVRSFLLVAILVFLASCSGPGVAGKLSATATASPMPQPTLTPTPIAINPTPLTMVQAWGNVQIASYPVTFGDRLFQPGGGYGENTITDDDQMCGNVESAIVTLTPAQILQQSQSIALLNLHTGVLTNIQTLPVGYQGLTCAVTGQWVIWLQAYGATYESFQGHWKIMALNRQTHELRQLDQSTLPNGQPAPNKILPYPSASNGDVVWTTFADNQANTAAVRYDLATKQQTVLAPNASNPEISWPWVSWGDGRRQGVNFENLETQQQVFLNQRPSGSALDGTSFVSADGSYTAITLYPSITPDHIGTTYIVGKGINGDFVQFPNVNDRLVTWDSNDTLFAFDRKLQRLVQIDGIFGNPHPYISSHYMVWAQAISKDDFNASMHGTPLHVNLYILDTNTLP